MARILTGIQSSGKPHLGNILGAVLPAITLSRNPDNETFAFIADMHSLTTVKDSKLRQQNTLSVAAAWIAFGFDVERNVFYRQSKVPIVAELTWYLSCFTPYPMLAKAHSFKDKADRLSDVNAGLFTYPVLMASDIILYDADIVPIGKDQKQHLEMTRDIARIFNRHYGDTFVIPEPRISEEIMTIPGTDGQKMSKSHGNVIDIFLPEKHLRKNIMSIQTDSTPLEKPKNPDTCNVFRIYKILAEAAAVEDMREKYAGGNYGYGQAKQAVYELILDLYREPRKVYRQCIDNPEDVFELLENGEQKATAVATAVLQRVRSRLGF